jgi:hypothetical protein
MIEEPDDKQIKNIFSKLPVPDASSKFVANLRNELSLLGELKYKKQQKNNPDLFGTWKLSLGVISFLFFLIFGTLIYTTDSLERKINEYTHQKAESAIARQVRIRIGDVGDYLDSQMLEFEKNMDEEDVDSVYDPITFLFVYNLDSEISEPLRLDGYPRHDEYIFDLNPGEYRLVLVEEKYGVVWDNQIVVSKGQADIFISLLLD